MNPTLRIFAPDIRQAGYGFPGRRGFAAYFAEKRGYAAASALPWIFFTGEGSFQARHDYWRTITERFCEAYSRQIGQWCEKHHLQYTGHYMGENALSSSTRMSGAVMPHYVFEHHARHRYAHR